MDTHADSLASAPDADSLRRRIEELEAENAGLRAATEDQRLGEALRSSLAAAAGASQLGLAGSDPDLLALVVQTAAHVLRSRAGALLLVHEESEELSFEVAFGEKAEQVKRFRLPMGQGIAGFTAATGQAIAVADVQHDPRWARDIAQAVSYVPRTLLSVPLVHGDRVIGVLEFLDREGQVPYDGADMAIAGRFAELAAVALEQSRLSRDIEALFRQTLIRVGGGTGADLEAQASRVAARAAGSQLSQETMRMAVMLAEIAGRGESARRLCAQLVEAVHAYAPGGSRV